MQSTGALDADMTLPAPLIERTRNREHGDFACNIAMHLARTARSNPRELATQIIAALPDSAQVAQVQCAGPGFINFHLSARAWHGHVGQVLEQGAAWGCNQHGKGQKVQIEFVSANPTGPLHVGHGRGAATGDSLARILDANGWHAAREFYYNDAGAQIENLAHSVQARCRGLDPDHADWPADGYRGEYIIDIATAFKGGSSVEADGRTVTANANVDDTDAIRRFAVAWLRREQDLDLRAFGVRFDAYYLESSLYEEGKVADVVRRLIERGHTYEQDDALWLRTTDFGDDKDRVMRKADGNYTYFVPDVAYHLTKWRRGFRRAINEQGADHHSTITRVRAGLQALDFGVPQGWPEYVLHQMVTVMRGGEEVKISKRAGSYVTLRDLIDEVGRDATRYFLVSRKADSQLVFDIDLARSQSNENPVYYIQYAHARVCSVWRQMEERELRFDQTLALDSLDLLDGDHEQALLVEISRYPEVVESAAEHLDPQLVSQYLRELAASFHAFYNAHQLLVDDAALRNARLALAAATRQTLANGLDLLGVSAPESM